jgi:hypothetical protein
LFGSIKKFVFEFFFDKKKKKMSDSNNIRVVCRFRPQNKIETSAGGTPIIQVTEGKNIYLNVRI